MQNITLTQDQENAKQALLSFLASDDPVFVLRGHAGTGKTSLIKYIHSAYLKTLPLLKLVDPKAIPKEWAFTATTNKAAEALQNSISLRTTTIHSLLGLVVNQNYTTGESYIFKKKDAKPVVDGIIVVDEASYIDDNLLTLILNSTPKSKIIFMGDANQLTPIGLHETPVFNKGYPEAHLNQVVRQSTLNPIQAVCAGFRNTIENHVGFPKVGICNEIQQLSKEDFDAAIKAEFSRPDWQQGDSKVLAWRNKTVQKYNTLLFKHCNQRNTFNSGDYVVNNHYVDGLKTDAEYLIEDIRPAKDLDVVGFNLRIAGFSECFFLPQKTSDYAKAKKQALNEGNANAVRTIANSWVDLRPAYACTVNKSQGSTYNKVFIDLGDLALCKDVLQLARLLYVAISRARHQVIFTGDLK